VPAEAEPAVELGAESVEVPDPGLDFPPPPMSPPDDDEAMKAPLRVYDLDDISPDPVVIAPAEAEPAFAEPIAAEPIAAPPVFAAPAPAAPVPAAQVPETPVPAPAPAEEPAVDAAPEVAEPAPVAPPVEPSASLVTPVFSDADVPDPVVPDPVVPDPVVPDPVVPDPVVPDPVVQGAEPEPAAAYPDSFPSRRELRERGGASATGEAVTSEPVADTSTPTSFDWLPSAATTPEPVTAAPAAPVPEASFPAAAASAPADLAAVPATAVPAAAAAAEAPTSAWAAEPGAPELEQEEPYGKPPTRMSTTSGWFIALMPLFAGILSVGAVKGAENYPRYLPFEWWALVAGVVVVLYLVTLLLAAADRRKLDEDGHAYPAHWAWAFLTAPVYLIARTLAVKRETGRTSVLLWVWLVFAALLVGGYFLTEYLAPGLLAAYTLPFL
jgi:hypothetical protein